jgi:hypothetical protein
MSPYGFGIALMLASALLALWIIARYRAFGPKSVLWALVHAALACILLRLVPGILNGIGASGVRGVAYVQIFAIALPFLVYGFLASGWVARAALGLLRP